MFTSVRLILLNDLSLELDVHLHYLGSLSTSSTEFMECATFRPRSERWEEAPNLITDTPNIYKTNS
jgi:hypothetical protein